MKIIDHKQVDMTDDEWAMYQKIVKSYTSATNKGEDLFKDLFEVNDKGIIIFLKPPTKFRTSFEVFLFLMSLFNHQHMRLVHQQVDDLCSQVKNKLREQDEKIKKLMEK